MNESPLEDDVPVLTITEMQLDSDKTDMDAKIWHSLPCSNEMDSVALLLQRFQMCQPEEMKDYRPQKTTSCLKKQTTPTVGACSILWGSWDSSINIIKNDNRSERPEYIVH